MSNQTPCFECEESPATLFCTDCATSHCESCSLTLHRPKTFRSHHILPFSQSPASPCKCPPLPNLPESFCSKCLISMCKTSVDSLDRTADCQQLSSLVECVYNKLSTLVSEKLDANSLSETEFLTLVTTFVEFSDVDLLSTVIDSFSFESVPEIPNIPSDLLSRIIIDVVSNQNKQIWLEEVLKKNLVGDEIQVIRDQLLATKIPLNINIGVFVWHDPYLNDLTEKIKKGFAENWPNINISINPCSSVVEDFKEIENYDVIVVESNGCCCPGKFLDQFLNQGKGLILFHCFPRIIPGGFSYSCFDDVTCGSWITVMDDQHDVTKTLPNDPIFINVDKFSTNCGYQTKSSVNGTLLATVNSGIPLIAKKEVSGGRLVEFGFFCTSSDSHDGPNWASSTDGHKMFANAIVWANKMV
ncbi:hypothetical protein GEMRC1_009408 [Eukaryota sp. GEM-RC1]